MNYVFLSPRYDLSVVVAGLFSLSTLKEQSTVNTSIYTLKCEVL